MKKVYRIGPFTQPAVFPTYLIIDVDCERGNFSSELRFMDFYQFTEELHYFTPADAYFI